MRVKQSVPPNLTRSKTRWLTCAKGLQRRKLCRCGDTRVCHGDEIDASAATESGRGRFYFITQIFVMRGTIYVSCIPQLLSVVFVAYFATILKELSCGKPDASYCFVSFDGTAHRLAGVVIGFALSHIAHVPIVNGTKCSSLWMTCTIPHGQ